MSLTTSQLLSLLQLPKIGNKSVMSMGYYAQEYGIELFSNDDILDFLIECIQKKIINRVSADNYDINTVNTAVNKANRIIEQSKNQDIGIVCYFDDLFPEKLRNIVDAKGKNNSPLFLYYKGNIQGVVSRPSIAIIGTREPTQEGIKAGEFFSAQFAKAGFNIVSGLAIGCDSSAHRGALSVGGITTAFLAHGLDYVYPKENIDLARKIIETGGVLLSEYPIDTPPMANYFVERDRLQSGLADATLVIQTGVTGGTLHATRATLQNCKPLYAVQFKDDKLRYHEKVKGNYMLLEGKFPEGKALPLTTTNIGSIIYNMIENHKEQDSVQNNQETPIPEQPEQLTLF